MPDWKKMVHERLGSASAAANREDTVSELAAHLEETYEAARSQGMTEPAAVTFALQEAGDWNVLAANIQRAQSEDNLMNHRAKSLWLPAMLTLLGANVSLALIQFAGLQPRLERVAHTGVLLYWVWLGTLPLFGALGAYLSRRAKGSIRARLAAGLSPALVMLITMCAILPWGLAVDGFAFFRLVLFGIGLINWVLLPALGLFVGAVPFLRETGVPRRLQPEV